MRLAHCLLNGLRKELFNTYPPKFRYGTVVFNLRELKIAKLRNTTGKARCNADWTSEIVGRIVRHKIA